MSGLDDTTLARELRGLTPPGGTNWQDVVRRAGRIEAGRRRRRLTVAVVVAALALSAGTALGIGRELFGWFAVSPPADDAPAVPASIPHVAGRTLSLPGREQQRLGAPMIAPLLGQDASLAVLSPDGRHVAYHSWDDSVPLLRVRDTATGRERLLARGAQTLAWRADGAIAYVEGERARFGRGAYLGRVVVRRGLDGEPERWTSGRGVYEVLAWSRGDLLVRVPICLTCGLAGVPHPPEPGIYALSRPGSLRRLPLATVAAVSPDGRVAFGRHDPVAGQDSPSALVRLVEVRTRRVLATVDLTSAARAAGMRGLLPGSIATAAWRGNEIVATFSGESSALVVIDASGGRLEVARVIRVAPRTLPGPHGVAFGTPALAPGPDRRVVVPLRASGGPAAVVLVCDLAAGRCERGRRLGVREWFAVVANRSRPARRGGG